MTIKALSFASAVLAGVNAENVTRSCLSETLSTGLYDYDVASY